MTTVDKPTLLVVGSGERMQTALEQALERHDLYVESVATESIVEAAFAAAPDLLLLIGDAAVDGGEAALTRLGGHPAASMVPVVLLSSEPGLDKRLGAFRHGVVAVVEKTASADGMARHIAELARELPERSGEVGGELGEATVDELVSLFSQQLRTGILSVSAAGNEGASAQVVLRAGRPVTEAIEELVERLKPLLSHDTGPLQYEFHESPTARLRLLEDEVEGSSDDDALAGRRILLIEQNPARADVLVQELRARGALVAVADGDGNGLERARVHDPDVVVLDGSGVDGWALPALRKLRRDPRLRWASLLVVDAGELWPSEAKGPDLARLGAALRPLVRPDQQLAERAGGDEAFDTRLELIGPSRLLRALTATGLGLKLTITHPRARLEIDVAEELVVGARLFSPGGASELAEGPAALAAMLGLGSGRVHVEHREAPSAANVMAPVDDALAAADREQAPIRPSLPPPSGLSDRPFEEERTSKHEKPAGTKRPEQLLGRLETLLEKLQTVLPLPEGEPDTGDGPADAEAAEPAIAPPPAAIPPARHPAVPRPAKPLGAPLGRAKPAAAKVARPLVPSPKKPAPANKPMGRRRSTLIGTAVPEPRTPPPWEAPPDEDDDIPVIEGTAEPGALASKPPVPMTAPAKSVPVEVPLVEISADVIQIPSLPPMEVTTLPPVEVAEEPTPPPAPPALPVAPPAPPELPRPVVAEALPIEHGVEHLTEPIEEPLELPTRRFPWAVFGVGIVVVALAGAGVFAYQRFGDRMFGGGTPPVAQLPEEDPTLTAGASHDAGEAVATDAGEAPSDSGAPIRDAASDAGSDAGLDTGIDAGPVEQVELEGEPDEVDEEPDEEPEEGAPGGAADELRRLIRSGNYERNRNHMQEAEREYLRALRIDHRNARALAGLTKVAISRRDGTQAVRWGQRLVQTGERNANNHVLLGDAYRAAGNTRAAQQSWRHALELSPGHRTATQRLSGAR